MRPLLFIHGLAFATTVLIANVDAIKCYIEGPNYKVEAVDCDEKLSQLEDAQGAPRGTFPRAKQCAIGEINVVEGGERIRVFVRDCLFTPCNREGVECTTLCSSDYCNGGPDPLNGGSGQRNRGPDPPNRGPNPPNGKGALTSTTPASLLIAVITGVIAAVGF